MGIVIAAVAAVIYSVVPGLAQGDASVPLGLMSWLALSYVPSGLAAWWHRPANRLGPLMILTGFTAFGASRER